MASRAELLERSDTMSHEVAWRLGLEKSGSALNPPIALNDDDQLALFESLETQWAIPPTAAITPRPAPRQAGWTSASLFSGCGGFDLGFEFAGIETAQAYDNSIAAVETFNLNHRPAARRADLSIQLPEVEGCNVLLAGAPCQGFSTNGRRDLDDHRNRLLESIDALAARYLPKAVVIENVPAALSGAHATHWLGMEDRLRAIGYNVRRLTLEAHRHGTAQNRKRLFLIAWLGSDCIQVDITDRPALTLRHALARLPLLHDHEPRILAVESDAYRIASRIGPGQKLSNVRVGSRNVATWDIPEVFGPTTASEQVVLLAVTRLRRRLRQRTFGDGDPVSISAIANEVGFNVDDMVRSLVRRGYLREIDGRIEHKHTYNGKYRRLEWGALSPTVDTHFSNASLFLHPQQNRGLTLREAMRIQGFPDWFRLTGSQRSRWQLVGNAVPPPLAMDLATFVREAILKA